MALEHPSDTHLGWRNADCLLWSWGSGGSLCRDSRPVMTSSPEARYFMQSSSSYPMLDNQAGNITAYSTKPGSLWSVVTSSLPLNSLAQFVRQAPRTFPNLQESTKKTFEVALAVLAGPTHCCFNVLETGKLSFFTQKKHFFPKH